MNKWPELVRRHVMKCLTVIDDDQDAEERVVAALEREGYRIVTGGQVEGDRWEIGDWRTGELLASGDDRDEFDRAFDEDWWHIDAATEQAGLSWPTPTPGLPKSLQDALMDWVDNNQADARALLTEGN